MRPFLAAILASSPLLSLLGSLYVVASAPASSSGGVRQLLRGNGVCLWRINNGSSSSSPLASIDGRGVVALDSERGIAPDSSSSRCSGGDVGGRPRQEQRCVSLGVPSCRR
jgi:hypothetical protein